MSAALDARLKAASLLFSEIASDAEAIDALCYHADFGDIPERFVDVFRNAARRMGWLADQGAIALGQEPVRVEGAAWLLSPAAREAMEHVAELPKAGAA